MASAQDMRDVLGLSGDVPRPAKKRKVVEKRPLEKGMAREVSALMGERAPPVSMISMQPKYKQRPKRSLKATPWEWTPFTNDARADGFTLSHWQRKKAEPTPAVEVPAEGSAEEPAAVEEVETPVKKPYQFAKYNIQVDVPEYSDETYESQLKDDDWSREETDYLIDLVKDYGQKWSIVWDRFDFKPTKTEDEDAPAEPKSRSMEDLKKRYYTVRAKMLAQEIPVASMNGQQYSLYQTLIHFDVKQESSRKKMTEAHLYRTDREVQEETALLAELQRIMANQRSLEASRKEMRELLEYPVSSPSSTSYSTSTALAQLFQQLLQADRSKKERRLKELPMSASLHAHRDSLASGSLSKRPRDSLASVASAGDHAPDARSRALSPHSRARFFVTTHDRLTGGVTFASDRLSKPRLAKSTVATERIGAVLAQLRVPDVVPLPTQAVVDEFERLMAKVHVLVELRKGAEKEEAEIKVRLAERRVKEGGGTLAVEDDARGTKRSASVLSEQSQGREKRRK